MLETGSIWQREMAITDGFSAAVIMGPEKEHSQP